MRFLLEIDKRFFQGHLRKLYRTKIVENRLLKHGKNQIDHSFLIQYAKHGNSELNTLCDKYGSDKGESMANGHPYDWPSHNYADFYEMAFGFKREHIKSVVECGLGTNNPNLQSSMGVNAKPGASLRVWRDYFPNADIIGCDIDTEILFNEERIRTFGCDQTDPQSIHKFQEEATLSDQTVDIIIDDGLHTFAAGKCFFENMIGKLHNEGIYIIEDIAQSDVFLYKNYFNGKSQYFVQYVHLYSPIRDAEQDNRLIAIRKKAIS